MKMNLLKIKTIKTWIEKAPQTKFDKPKDDRHKNWWILDKIAR